MHDTLIVLVTLTFLLIGTWDTPARDPEAFAALERRGMFVAYPQLTGKERRRVAYHLCPLLVALTYAW